MNDDMKRLTWIVLLVLTVSIGANIYLWQHQPTEQTTIEHDTLWRDTVIHDPQPAETINTGRVVYIKVAVPQPQTQRDTVHDSIDVPVPIAQRRYDDSLYTAWVSGYQPALDSILLRLPTVTYTITRTIVTPSPRLTLGIQVGAGIGILQHHPDIYVGIGAQYNLWRR